MTEEPEVLDGVPVLADDERAVVAARGARMPVVAGVQSVAVQTVAVMGASMVAGATAVALARLHRTRRIDRKRRKALPAGVLASRSFLVDVHVLGDRTR